MLLLTGSRNDLDRIFPGYPLPSSAFPQTLPTEARAGQAFSRSALLSTLFLGAESAAALYGVTRIVDIFFGPARIRLASNL